MSTLIINLLMVVAGIIATMWATAMAALVIAATRARRGIRCACRMCDMSTPGLLSVETGGVVHERDRCCPAREVIA